MARQRARANTSGGRRGGLIQSAPIEIQAKYTKTGATPVLHTDGMFGGLTPGGQLYVAFFSEHARIPDAAILRRDPEGETYRPVEADQLPGVVREVGVEMIMTLNVARAFREWLDVRLKQAEDFGIENVPTQSEENQS